jgi:hypothetical protein
MTGCHQTSFEPTILFAIEDEVAWESLLASREFTSFPYIESKALGCMLGGAFGIAQSTIMSASAVRHGIQWYEHTLIS